MAGEWPRLKTMSKAAAHVEAAPVADVARPAAAPDDELLAAVLDSVGEGLVVHTPGGLIVNATARRLLELEEDIPVPSRSRAEPDETVTASELLALFSADVQDERRFRRRVALASGRAAVLDGTTTPIAANGGRGTVTVFRDVTVEHKREFLTEQFLERLFDELPLATVVAEPETLEVLSANEAFMRLVGYPEATVIGCKPPYPWLADEGEVERLAARPPRQAAETLFRHENGRLIPVQLTRFRIPNPDGSPAAIVAVLTDLSEQRRFEQQLLQSGKLATIGELAAGVAHEINNPLFAILGLVEFLLKDAVPGTKAHDRLVLIQQTGFEIKEIVRALLDFAREPSEEREVVYVRDTARETLELFRRTSAAKGVEIEERYGDEPTPVHGNANQLKQIFLNLVTNASQALGGEGRIEVTVERRDGWVVATVADDGPGIPEDVLPKVFEPFFTTKRSIGGSGLGLSVSHGIAHSHGGSLTAENLPDGGARFVLRLPPKEAA